MQPGVGRPLQDQLQQALRAADGQRQQLVRRLAAEDDSLDILGLDVTWAAEFAEARWIREWTGTARRRAVAGTLRVPLQTSTWKGKLYAVPYNTNTQLLWYRKDLVPTPPRTWAEMLDMASTPSPGRANHTSWRSRAPSTRA